MIKIPRPTTVDFETEAIQGRPDYPPVPVGVAIKKWGKKGKYYSWGHPVENNCTFEQAQRALAEVWDGPLLFHNCKFDIDVAETHCGLPLPEWDAVHDTTFALFLDDPHQRQVGLKEAAARLLGVPPEERDAVAEWLISNLRIKKSDAGAHIAYAPGDIVGPYALGDCERTELLFAKLYPSISDRGMVPSYDRERRLVPILLDMERRGIRVDLRRLQQDVESYCTTLSKLETWVRKRLGADETLNLDSGAQLVAALEAAGLADVSKMGLTKTGKVSTNKTALAAGVKDAQLAGVLQYISQLGTCLRTFMEPWLAVAERSEGRIYCNWNQIRGGSGGTRTGRFSSSNPNFQNIPKEFNPLFDGKGLKPPFKLPSLPLCRGYIVPYEPDHVIIGRDYSQQEPRILGHFEGGTLMEQYQANPWIDYHDNAKYHLELIFKRKFDRKPVKNINLGLIYGQGVASLAERNGESYEDTKRLKDAILTLYPGLKGMYAEMKRRAKAGEPIRTWGGREYFCEPPMIINGRVREFDYKMTNVLVQGSAADCTKEGMIRFSSVAKEHWFMLLQVHDEIVVSVPREDLAEAQEVLRTSMESVEFDVPILSEGAWSSENWASMIDFDKKGSIV